MFISSSAQSPTPSLHIATDTEPPMVRKTSQAAWGLSSMHSSSRAARSLQPARSRPSLRPEMQEIHWLQHCRAAVIRWKEDGKRLPGAFEDLQLHL